MSWCFCKTWRNICSVLAIFQKHKAIKVVEERLPQFLIRPQKFAFFNHISKTYEWPLLKFCRQIPLQQCKSLKFGVGVTGHWKQCCNEKHWGPFASNDLCLAAYSCISVFKGAKHSMKLRAGVVFWPYLKSGLSRVSCHRCLVLCPWAEPNSWGQGKYRVTTETWQWRQGLRVCLAEMHPLCGMSLPQVDEVVWRLHRVGAHYNNRCFLV